MSRPHHDATPHKVGGLYRNRSFASSANDAGPVGWGSAAALSLALICGAGALLAINFPHYSRFAILPIVLLAFVSPRKIIVVSSLAGALITLYGASGEVNYLGVAVVSDSAVAAAMTFYLFLAGGAYLGSLTRPQRQAAAFTARPPIWNLLAIAAIAVLAGRFALTGVPLLAGNDNRLIGVAGLPPLMGLASGVLPILTAYVPAPSGVRASIMKVTVCVLVFGTGSRLLLAAVLLGFIYQYATARSASGGTSGARRRAFAVASGFLLIYAVIRVYEIRTDPAAALIWEGRSSGVDGLAGIATTLLGPSLFFAARNGLVVYEILSLGDFAPSGGFILGGLANSFASGSDPERWLTEALGLDVLTTGAVATPIWSGATIDFGAAAPLVALAIGALLAQWEKRWPPMAPWLAFAVVLSSYGSYLVSVQFVTASIAATLILAFCRDRRQSRDS